MVLQLPVPDVEVLLLEAPSLATDEMQLSAPVPRLFALPWWFDDWDVRLRVRSRARRRVILALAEER